MGENSRIDWTDHTFNPWMGCVKVSPACDNCYAERNMKRYGSGHLWQGAPPEKTSQQNWYKPLLWSKKAELEGVRKRVFCASYADVFDDRVPSEWRNELRNLIGMTPWLDWLILTKRPEKIPSLWKTGWSNVWLGVTVENRETAAKRIPILRGIPAAVRFLSCEPLLEEITPLKLNGIDWVICGGESGQNPRPMETAWAFNLMAECAMQRVPFFMKQMSGKREIPELLRVRQWPKVGGEKID